MFRIATVLLAVLCAAHSLAQGRDVPPAFQQLYSELESELDVFTATMASQWTGVRSPVLFSAQIVPANTQRLELPGDRYAGILATIDEMKELGVGAVTLTVSYPTLLPAFYSSVDEYRSDLDFYRQLALEIRSRGLTLIVKSAAMLPSPPVAAFYRTVGSFAEYKAGRLDVARTVARELRPDFLTIQSEPDTEQFGTGQPVNSPAASVDLVNELVTGLRLAGFTGVAVGAGFGTWQAGYREFAEALATQTNLDYVDIHIYPIQRGFLARALEIADIARDNGKQIALGEAWLHKIHTSELPYAPILSSEVNGRNPYSFWAPLDQKFLHAIGALAHHKRFVFISPFWTTHFFAYLDYSSAKELGLFERTLAVNAASIRNAKLGRLTATAQAYSFWLGPPRSR
jgi:hypothetical protein